MSGGNLTSDGGNLPSSSQQDVSASYSQSAKNGKITNILSDYEKTKNINQELLKNFGSPKAPIFSKINAATSNQA